MSSADLSLWTRITGHDPDDLPRALWEERTLVKTWLMRGTLHLVPAEDLPIYCAALDSRGQYTGAWLRYFDVTANEMERLVDVIAESLDEPRTRLELGAAVKKRLRRAHGEEPPGELGQLPETRGAPRRPLLRAERGAGGHVRPARRVAPSWREVDPDEAKAELVRRFLAVYGPAAKSDFTSGSAAICTRRGNRSQTSSPRSSRSASSSRATPTRSSARERPVSSASSPASTRTCSRSRLARTWFEPVRSTTVSTGRKAGSRRSCSRAAARSPVALEAPRHQARSHARAVRANPRQGRARSSCARALPRRRARAHEARSIVTSPVRSTLSQRARTPARALIVDSMMTRYISCR